MGKSSTFANDVLKLIFNATPIANVADNAASSPLTNLFVSLHTADPGVGGSQTTSEAAFGGYARVAVARTTSGWTASSSQATNPVATINFPVSTGTPSEVETFFAIGTATSGAGKILYSGSLSPTVAMNAPGITVKLTTATTVTEA